MEVGRKGGGGEGGVKKRDTWKRDFQYISSLPACLLACLSACLSESAKSVSYGLSLLLVTYGPFILTVVLRKLRTRLKIVLPCCVP